MKLQKEISLYTLFGVLTTMISIGTYKLFLVLGIYYIIATTLSATLAVIFAFMTNRFFVFESKGNFISEGIKFFSGRIIIFLAETAILIIAVSWMKLDEFYSKVAVTLLVIICNYMYSKFIVFKKGGQGEEI
ncbi:MAG: GtrA family protein [Clostridiales bacterium]|nr:GtrA family protein [Clostridiales bacterium]